MYTCMIVKCKNAKKKNKQSGRQREKALGSFSAFSIKRSGDVQSPHTYTCFEHTPAEKWVIHPGDCWLDARHQCITIIASTWRSRFRASYVCHPNAYMLIIRMPVTVAWHKLLADFYFFLPTSYFKHFKVLYNV